MVQSNIPDCRLLNLPRELRDQIYTYTFCGTNFDIGGNSKCPGLLTANRQLHAETIKPFFTFTTSCFGKAPNSDPDDNDYEGHLKRVPAEHLAFMDRLEYHLTYPKAFPRAEDREEVRLSWENWVRLAIGVETKPGVLKVVG